MAASVLCQDWRANQTVPEFKVLGVPMGPYLERASGKGLRHFWCACDQLKDAGLCILHVPAMPEFERLAQDHDTLLSGEAARFHASWFATHREQYHPLTADMISRGSGVDEAAIDQARESRLELRYVLSELMDAHQIDLWISPSATGPAPRGLEDTGDSIMNLPWSHSGLPTLSLPASKTAMGLPLGLQISGRWWADEEVLAWSADIEAILRKSAERT
jgi:Asp-tRNA(Asn)/Glu-tRNA(Gln) amidotransferase A subunit family amidase